MGKKEEFLIELSELSKKHGMFIGGCGCCNSPYVEDEIGDDLFESLEGDNEKKEYEVK